MKFHILIFLLTSCKPVDREIPDTAYQSVVIDTPDAGQNLIQEPEYKSLSEFETKFKYIGKKYEGRAKNIELIINKLNELVLNPKEEFSFNNIVGPRDADAGFYMAPAIFLGELTEGIGGGTCQVSSTLHAAARFSGLKIIEYHGHSRPSEYIKMGLDSTVSYPDLDLKFKNQFEFPVKIKAEISKIDDVYMNLAISLNSQVDPKIKVTHSFHIQSYEKYGRVIRTTGKFRGKFKRKLQNGSTGIIGLSVFKYEHPNGKIEYSKVMMTYKPINDVYDVGPDFDSNSLPPLP